jgi:hypothetical protein
MSATGQSMAAQDACARWMPRKQTYCARVAPGTARPARLPRRWNASGSELLSGGLRASLPQRPRRAGTRRTSSSGSASPRNASRRCWRPRDTLAPSAASHSVISGSALTTTTPAARYRPRATPGHVVGACAACCASGATPGSAGWRHMAVRSGSTWPARLRCGLPDQEPPCLHREGSCCRATLATAGCVEVGEERVQFLIRLGCARAREVIDRRGRTDALMAGKLGDRDVLSRRLRRLSCVTGSHGSRPFRAR